MNFYLVIGIGAVGILALWSAYRFTRLGKRPLPFAKENKLAKAEAKDEKTEGIDQFVEVEARVYDNTNRTIYNATIPASVVRQIRATHANLGRKWLRDGKWMYALNKTDTGAYKPVQVPMTLNDPPSELHRALQQQETGIVFNVEMSESVFGKYGPFIWIGIIGAVAIFLLMANRGGG